MVHAYDWRLESNGSYWRLAYRDAKGIIRRTSLGAKARVSKREAMRLCRQIVAEAQANPGATANRERVTLADWIAEHLDSANIAESTIDVYESTRTYLLEHFTGARLLRTIDRDDAARFVGWLHKQTFTRGKGEPTRLTEQTVRKHVRNTKRLFAAAADRDLIAFNPFDREASSPVEVDQNWRYVEDHEIQRVIAATDSHHWRALFALLRYAGLRRGEALRLRWTDIDWQARRLTVVNPEGKRTTKKRQRVVPIDPRLHAVLIAAFEAAEPGADLVAPLPELNLIRNAGVIIRRAGLTPWPKLLHTLRKNCETDWFVRFSVLDVCQWLGHSPEVAKRFYHQVREDSMQRASGVVSPKSAQENPVE